MYRHTVALEFLAEQCNNIIVFLFMATVDASLPNNIDEDPWANVRWKMMIEPCGFTSSHA